MPRLGPGPEIGMPHIRLSPLVACSKPAAMRSSVDLPQPEAPIRQMNSPLRTRKFAPRSASIEPPPCAYIFPAFFISPMGIDLSAMRRAPGEQTAADPHHELARQEAEEADHDHAGYHDLGAR